MRRRRRLLASLGLSPSLLLARPALVVAGTVDPAFGVVRPGQRLSFPADHGAHPNFRTEWWYMTGWLDPVGDEPPQGVQITFFRSRTEHAPANPSRFAPHQLLFAHAALARPAVGRLLHDQRAAREGFGWAEASTQDTDVRIGDWRFQRLGADAEPAAGAHGATYRTRIAAADFDLDLGFTTALGPVLQGVDGFSRKGPEVAQASHYYSRPQLRISGTVTLHPRDGHGQRGPAQAVTGTAWLDHEWSTEVLDPRASGWDWCGLNLDDGTALMAFAIRDRQQASFWSHARAIDAQGRALAPPLQAQFTPVRWWQSLRTGVRYPVAMRLVVAAGLDGHVDAAPAAADAATGAARREFELEPLFDDQELDSRGSTGAIYWEGAVRVREGGRVIGRGYLELTGYGSRLAI